MGLFKGGKKITFVKINSNIMAFGIAELSIIPMRKEKSERSELVSQVLFGELYEVVATDGEWVYIRLLHDGCEGWIDGKMYKEVGEEYAQCYRETEHVLTDEVFNLVLKEGDWGNKLIVAGSVLPFYDANEKRLKVGDDIYTVVGSMKEGRVDNVRDLLVQYALKYYNVSYLWGGRTPYGIDCSGLTQMAYRLAGIPLPREIGQQVKAGQALSFMEESLPGDLAFFGDEAGVITHVGMLWESGRIIHASGRVRVDKIDHHGIFNEEIKRYTHALKLIKRFV